MLRALCHLFCSIMVFPSSPFFLFGLAIINPMRLFVDRKDLEEGLIKANRPGELFGFGVGEDFHNIAYYTGIVGNYFVKGKKS